MGLPATGKTKSFDPALPKYDGVDEDGVLASIQWIRIGLQNELAFWKWWLRGHRDGKWIKDKFARDWTYDDLCSLVPADSAPKILNAGSGPIAPSSLQCGGRVVRVVSADGLALLYWRLYEHLSLHAPELPMQCMLEKLSHCFPSNYFDVVHVRNALDH